MRPKKILTVFSFLIMLCFALTSCSLFSSPDYFPLGKGSQWTYSCNGVEAIYRVTDDAMADGKMCSVTETIIDGQAVQKLYFIKTDKEILEVMKQKFVGSTTIYSPPQPLMRFPVKVGDSWEWKGDLANNNSADLRSKVTRKEKISTPAGNFDTMKIETEGFVNNTTATKMEMWFAPNVGLVKEEFMYGVDTVSLVLKSYKIVK